MADSKVQELERSVEMLESQMREQIARTRAGATTTLVVGIILLAALVIVMFSYVSIGEIKIAMEPTNMVQAVVGLTDLEAKIDTALATAESELTAKAPETVAQVREELTKRIPDVRKQVEEAADEYIAKLAAELDRHATRIMDEFYAMHKQELGDFVGAVVQKDNTAAVEEALQDSLEGLIGPALDENLQKFNLYMDDYERQVKQLLAAQKPLRDDREFWCEAAVRMLIGIDDFLKEEEKDRAKPPR